MRALAHFSLRMQMQAATAVTSHLDDMNRADAYHGEVSPDSIVFVQHGEGLIVKLAEFGSDRWPACFAPEQLRAGKHNAPVRLRSRDYELSTSFGKFATYLCAKAPA